MQKVIIQNEAVNAVIDKDVQACVQQIFAKVVGLNNFDKIADDIAKSAIVALTEKSFMTTDLELTDKQKEALSEGMSDLVKRACKLMLRASKRMSGRRRRFRLLRSVAAELFRACYLTLGKKSIAVALSIRRRLRRTRRMRISTRLSFAMRKTAAILLFRRREFSLLRTVSI